MSLTVYELIQELAKYRPETEVKFHVKADFDTDVSATFDRSNEDDVQEVTVTAEFDDDVDYDDISDRERGFYGSPYIQIDLTY